MVSSIRTIYFGRRWAIPLFDPGRKTHQVLAPIGRPCYRCKVNIVDGDFGLIRPHGLGTSVWKPIHAECKLVDDVGGVNHVTRVCRCYIRTPGYKPPAYTGTLRQEALEVWKHVQKLRANVNLDPM